MGFKLYLRVLKACHGSHFVLVSNNHDLITFIIPSVFQHSTLHNIVRCNNVFDFICSDYMIIH